MAPIYSVGRSPGKTGLKPYRRSKGYMESAAIQTDTIDNRKPVTDKEFEDFKEAIRKLDESFSPTYFDYKGKKLTISQHEEISQLIYRTSFKKKISNLVDSINWGFQANSSSSDKILQ